MLPKIQPSSRFSLCPVSLSLRLKQAPLTAPSLSFQVALGEHGINPNYFEQNQAEALDLELTVLETLVQVGVQCSYKQESHMAVLDLALF